MRKKTKSIPVNNWSAIFSGGVIISRILSQSATDLDEVGESHRDDWHVFILQLEGTTAIEIDFVSYNIGSSSVIYINPNQVHRVLSFHNATIITWAINNETLKPEYLELLNGITPVKPLILDAETFSVMSQTAALGVKYSERKQEALYNALLKDCGNTLVGFVLSQYLTQTNKIDNSSRPDAITRAFRSLLERDFATVKSPGAYAATLNISTPYLNECVKGATGLSVSQHISQRVVLEAKRLLYHSGRSIKEIAYELGYEDHSYFTRFFNRVANITPSAFRDKNFE